MSDQSEMDTAGVVMIQATRARDLDATSNLLQDRSSRTMSFKVAG